MKITAGDEVALSFKHEHWSGIIGFTPYQFNLREREKNIKHSLNRRLRLKW
jgi:hypothetical protein